MKKKAKLIYFSEKRKVSLDVLNYINSIHSLKEIIFLTIQGNEKLEEKIIQLELDFLNLYIPLSVNKIDWKNKDLNTEIKKFTLEDSTSKILFLIESPTLINFKKNFSIRDASNYLMILLPGGKLFTFHKNENKFEKLNSKLNNSSYCFKELESALRKSYKEQNISRFDHTIRVVKTAREIALKCNLNSENLKKLLLACAYHDFAKNWGRRKLLNFLDKKEDKFLNEVKNNWHIRTWHGPIASNYLLSKKLVTDQTILESIKYHTKPIHSLDMIGKILVISDKMEPFKKNNFSVNQYNKLWKLIEQGEILPVFKELMDSPYLKKKFI